MFADTYDKAVKNGDILKELSKKADAGQEPSSEVLLDAKIDISNFLIRWKDIVSINKLSRRACKVAGCIFGASVISTLDYQVKDIKQLAIKLDEEYLFLSKAKTYFYFIEKLEDKFTAEEIQLMGNFLQSQ